MDSCPTMRYESETTRLHSTTDGRKLKAERVSTPEVPGVCGRRGRWKGKGRWQGEGAVGWGPGEGTKGGTEGGGRNRRRDRGRWQGQEEGQREVAGTGRWQGQDEGQREASGTGRGTEGGGTDRKRDRGRWQGQRQEEGQRESMGAGGRGDTEYINQDPQRYTIPSLSSTLFTFITA
ncbi:hypothetical protein Pmani_021723 [Petrolisthes manimaculis]|uniref:Uncharacterized protein n=1 Tax=Petrolisthes manimaculis TaxID=1843537 RepID=A0AAE1U1D8_9EUCA|nr:hypothetical protein Pmani_021723 [Petrolisthes manimaculis]